MPVEDLAERDADGGLVEADRVNRAVLEEVVDQNAGLAVGLGAVRALGRALADLVTTDLEDMRVADDTRDVEIADLLVREGLDCQALVEHGVDLSPVSSAGMPLTK